MRFLQKSKFVKHSLILLSGNAINQVVLLATYPIIARLFLPSDFGLFEQVNAIFAFLVVLTSLRYESAIIIAKSDQEAKNLLALSLLIMVFLVFLTSGCVVLLARGIADVFSNPDLEKFLYFIPIFLLFAGGQQALYNWEIRTKHFYQANVSNIFKSSSNSVLRVVTGFAQLSTLGLFLSRAVSFFLSLFVLLRRELTGLVQAIMSGTISAEGMRNAAKEHKRFPLYMSWGVVFSGLSIAVIPVVLSYLYGVTFMGYYAMATAVLNIPIAIVKNAIRTVYLQRASERVLSGKDLGEDLKRISLALAGMGILPLLLIILYGPAILAFVLGDRWHMAGTIASIIAPWIFITLVDTPSLAVLPVIGLQRYFVVLQSIILTTRILAFYIGATLFGDPLHVIGLLAVQGILVNIFNLGYVLTRVRNKNLSSEYSRH